MEKPDPVNPDAWEDLAALLKEKFNPNEHELQEIFTQVEEVVNWEIYTYLDNNEEE